MIHLLIGYAATFPLFPKIFGISILVIGLIVVFLSSNEKEEALLMSCYVVGAEVFVRMIQGFPSYEAGKYAVIAFLLIGTFIGEFKQQFSLSFLFYLLLLLLGIIFTQVPEGESIRKAIIFNLSGPIVLGVSALYFYKRPIRSKELIDAFFLMLLPLFSLVVYLYIRTPDLKEIVFGGVANFKTSGGFGPNQVATALGLGIFIITMFLLKKHRLSGFVFLDVLFLMYFIYRGLLTFSRGGVLTGFVAIIVFAFFYFLHQNGSVRLFLKYFFIGGIFIIATWIYTSEVTGGMLDNRYTGKNARGIQKKDISSGRVAIFEEQIKNFIRKPLGIGVGNGKYDRQLKETNITDASHNEIGRLMEEHGVIGMLLLIMLLTIPLTNIWNSNNYQRAFLITCYLLWFLTINHSAMRIAFPGLIYALSLIKIVEEDEKN